MTSRHAFLFFGKFSRAEPSLLGLLGLLFRETNITYTMRLGRYDRKAAEAAALRCSVIDEID